MHFTILNGRFLKPTGFALNLKKTVQSVQINLAVNIKHLQHPKKKKKTKNPKPKKTSFPASGHSLGSQSRRFCCKAFLVTPIQSSPLSSFSSLLPCLSRLQRNSDLPLTALSMIPISPLLSTPGLYSTFLM